TAPGMIVFREQKRRWPGLRPVRRSVLKENALARRSAGRARLGRDEAFALSFLAGELAGAADGFGLLAGALLGRLLVVIAELHLAEDAFALHLFLQRPQRLIHIVIANDDLHAPSSPFQC